MRIAASMCRFSIANKELDLLVCLYEMVLEKGENGTIRDAVEIEAKVKSRDDIKRRSELLDKVSEKV